MNGALGTGGLLVDNHMNGVSSGSNPWLPLALPLPLPVLLVSASSAARLALPIAIAWAQGTPEDDLVDPELVLSAVGKGFVNDCTLISNTPRSPDEEFVVEGKGGTLGTPAPLPARPRFLTSSNAIVTASANLLGCLERDFRSGDDARVPGADPDAEAGPVPSSKYDRAVLRVSFFSFFFFSFFFSLSSSFLTSNSCTSSSGTWLVCLCGISGGLEPTSRGR